MRYKRSVAGVAILLLILGLTACGGADGTTDGDGAESEQEPSAEDQDVVLMKLGHDTIDDVQDLISRSFAERVEEFAEGRIKTEVYPSSQLGDNETMNQMVRTGALEAMIQPTAFLTPVVPELGVFDLPFLFPNPDVENQVLNSDATEQLGELLQEEGYVPILWASVGFKQFNTTFPVDDANAFEGRVMRSIPADILIRQFEAWGASVTPMSFSEVYTGLQQGTIEGHENPADTIYQMKFHEVAPYVTLSDHGSIPLVLTVSQEWFEGLPADLQDAIKQAGTETAREAVEIMVSYQREAVENLEAADANVSELPEEERQTLRERAEPVWEYARNEPQLGPVLEQLSKEIEAVAQ